MTASWEEFERLELTVGVITEVEDFPEARNPAYKLTIDFGPRGTRRSSAQATQYPRVELLGRQVVCVLGSSRSASPASGARCSSSAGSRTNTG